MPMDRFLIAPSKTGLQTDLKSWLIMDDAFEYLQNAYVFRGRVRKRFGSVLTGSSQLQSRLRVQIGTTDGAGNLAFTSLPGAILNVGSMFSAGSTVFQVITVPTIVGNAATLTTGSSAIGTVRLDSTAPNVYQFRITGAQASIAATAVFWYPSNPVMGLEQYIAGSINNHPSYAFDTQFAYKFTPGTGWARSGTAIWHGTNLNYFWGANWQGLAGTPVLFVSNFNATTGAARPLVTDDPIWYTTDGSTWTSAAGGTANGFYFLPAGGAVQTGPYVQTARIIVAFKNRLVFLNTIENNNSGGAGVGTATQYVNRARYSFNGSPFARNAWYEPNQSDSSGGVVNNNNIAAGAGFIDASTEEQIVSAEFIKDRLIVYFERSTWELAYTGNEVLPFIWQKLNTELGSMSTFSTIPFDKEVLTIGESGIHACNGSNVIRIDTKIPDQIFEFDNENSLTLRTVGIRDYYTETAIWTFSSDLEQPTQNFPNQMLIYNYRNDSWALFDDCFTFFGYFEQQFDQTWATSGSTTWTNANFTWNSGQINSNQRQILAGNQEGFVVIIKPDVSRNAPGLSITNITYNLSDMITLTIINHNLSATPSEYLADNDYILIENVVADATTMALLNGQIFQVFGVVDADNINIDLAGALPSGTYFGGGTASRVSNIQITTKRYNPYVDDDRSFYLAKVDFGVQPTGSWRIVDGELVLEGGGAITVDYYPSSTQLSMIQDGKFTGAIMGNSVLETSPYNPLYYPIEQYQELLWHPVYFQTSGQFIQLILKMSYTQMQDTEIALADFVLEGMTLYTQPTSERFE